MSATAQISITTGPDRGKVFDVVDELVHIGSGPDNQIVLLDTMLAEHQASIVSRNGRYAIYTMLADGAAIDGNPIPAERWVWLPDGARVRLSARTTFQFTYAENGEGDSELPSEPPTSIIESSGARTQPPIVTEPMHDVPSETLEFPPEEAGGIRTKTRATASPPAVRSKPSRPEKPPRPAGRGQKATQHVARFIVDRGGEAAVQLGEDGQLPELKLTEATERKPSAKRDRGTNPLVIYLALTFSFVMSIALLLIDLEPSSSRTIGQQQARQEIEEFYRTKDGELQLYQRYLREARLAHSRRDNEAERRAYRKVLDLLASEDNNRFTGLTGNLERDRRLRELIAVLMRD